eukprot:5069653-Prymnesium_polylepis.1
MMVPAALRPPPGSRAGYYHPNCGPYGQLHERDPTRQALCGRFTAGLGRPSAARKGPNLQQLLRAIHT